jgi:hypothetical protein
LDSIWPQIAISSAQRDAKISKSFQLFADVAFQDALHSSGINRQRPVKSRSGEARMPPRLRSNRCFEGVWQAGFGEVDLAKWIWQTGFGGFGKRIQQAKVVII